MPRRILVVPHQLSPGAAPLCAAITEACVLSGLEVHAAPELEQATRLAVELRPALVLFNVRVWNGEQQECLWQMGQLRSARTIRKAILAREATLDGRVEALEAGADDFLVRPISARELHARFQALLRSCERLHPEDEPQSLGELQLYHEGMEIAVGGRRSRLSPREFSLLAYLMERPGHVLSREELLENLWYPSADIEARRVVDVTILRLREKIEDDPARPVRLLTRRGEGYCLIDPSA